MEDNKHKDTRGQQHRANKKKYRSRPGSQVLPSKISVSKSRSTALGSNWDRYREERPANTPASGTDFSILANAPLTHGSHFQFKQDKEIADNESVKASDLFNLNLNLLDRSLATIPFYIRSGISEEYFSENQRKIMLQKSNLDDYLSYLEAQALKGPREVVFGADREESESSESEAPGGGAEEVKSGDNDDLEQWLDDILDD